VPVLALFQKSKAFSKVVETAKDDHFIAYIEEEKLKELEKALTLTSKALANQVHSC